MASNTWQFCRIICIMRAAVDPKITEQFLLEQEEVEDASVWIRDKKLHAHVTRSKGSQLDETSLKSFCEYHIGAEQTPTQIILIEPMNKD